MISDPGRRLAVLVALAGAIASLPGGACSITAGETEQLVADRGTRGRDGEVTLRGSDLEGACALV